MAKPKPPSVSQAPRAHRPSRRGRNQAHRVWTIGDLLEVALATQPITPSTSAPDRRRRFRVIEGGKGEP
jgi:hypothetical protein